MAFKVVPHLDLDRRLSWLDTLGDQLMFYVRALLWTPRALRRYLREIRRLLAEVTFGSGALGVIGGTIGVMIAMTLFTGTVVGLQGYAALNQIGTAAFTGFVSAYFNTREIAPLVAGLALSATVGAGFTAQLGAMRISEEVDALEGMGVPSLPYLVTTRIAAGVVAIIPLYGIGLLSSYVSSREITVLFNGQSAGTYDHYFGQFLASVDVLWSFGKVLIFSRDGDPGALLLRLPGVGRPGRGGHRGRPCRTDLDRADQPHRLLPQPGDLGRHDHREGGRMIGVEDPPGVKARRRLVGLAFLMALCLLVWLSIAVYQKRFTDVATVTLRTSSVGNEMHPHADVKLRGRVIGEVRGISADGSGARLRLALQPGALKDVPANVTAQMLPTTLFGERYVALIPPATPSPRRLASGAEIGQDRSANAIELEKVLQNVLPLLTAVRPDKLSATLTAIAQALQGRGEELGQTLVRFDDYLGKTQPAAARAEPRHRRAGAGHADIRPGHARTSCRRSPTSPPRAAPSSTSAPTSASCTTRSPRPRATSPTSCGRTPPTSSGCPPTAGPRWRSWRATRRPSRAR